MGNPALSSRENGSLAVRHPFLGSFSCTDRVQGTRRARVYGGEVTTRRPLAPPSLGSVLPSWQQVPTWEHPAAEAPRPEQGPPDGLSQQLQAHSFQQLGQFMTQFMTPVRTATPVCESKGLPIARNPFSELKQGHVGSARGRDPARASERATRWCLSKISVRYWSSGRRCPEAVVTVSCSPDKAPDAVTSEASDSRLRGREVLGAHRPQVDSDWGPAQDSRDQENKGPGRQSSTRTDLCPPLGVCVTEHIVGGRRLPSLASRGTQRAGRRGGACTHHRGQEGRAVPQGRSQNQRVSVWGPTWPCLPLSRPVLHKETLSDGQTDKASGPAGQSPRNKASPRDRDLEDKGHYKPSGLLNRN